MNLEMDFSSFAHIKVHLIYQADPLLSTLLFPIHILFLINILSAPTYCLRKTRVVLYEGLMNQKSSLKHMKGLPEIQCVFLDSAHFFLEFSA